VTKLASGGGGKQPYLTDVNFLYVRFSFWVRQQTQSQADLTTLRSIFASGLCDSCIPNPRTALRLSPKTVKRRHHRNGGCQNGPVF